MPYNEVMLLRPPQTTASKRVTMVALQYWHVALHNDSMINILFAGHSVCVFLAKYCANIGSHPLLSVVSELHEGKKKRIELLSGSNHCMFVLTDM